MQGGHEDMNWLYRYDMWNVPLTLTEPYVKAV
jgi:hypothetical protein